MWHRHESLHTRRALLLPLKCRCRAAAHSRRLQLPGAAALGSTSAVLLLRILSERAARRVGAAPPGSASAVRLLRFLGAPRPRCATPCRRDATGLGVSCGAPPPVGTAPPGSTSAGSSLWYLSGLAARRVGAPTLVQPSVGCQGERRGRGAGPSSRGGVLPCVGFVDARLATGLPPIGCASAMAARPHNRSAGALASPSRLELRVAQASRRRRSDAAVAKLLTPGSVWHWR